MFVGFGTLVNICTIIGGAALGVLIGGRMVSRTRILITEILGLITILSAIGAIAPLRTERYINSIPRGWTLLAILGSLLIGGLIGSALSLESRLDNLGEKLRVKFGAHEESNFIEGFVSASLLFAIGPLAILGSISDGMSTGVDQLLLKSSLDFFAAMAFAASLGWGVAASVIPVGIYQGIWTVIGFALGNILDGYQIDAMTITGGVLLVCIGLRLLKIKDIAVGNLLPALFIAPVFVLVLHGFI
ncbi:unannotated protein [freshwater metagenome]|uniref:Unannotated protein n=1 Tax=freshwater metagenome TaxID=449393 RepID=A0A6J6CPY5_9ZZZZ|nr:DUF554 family protein [Actinomycetota bacterium]